MVVKNDMLDLTRCPAIGERPRDALWQLKMLSYCCTNDANRSCFSLRSDKYFYQFPHFIRLIPRVLYVHRCTRHNHRTASMRCSVSHTCNAEVSRACDKQTSTTTNIVDDTACFSVRASSSMRTVKRVQNVADSHTFSASEPETSRPVEKRFFTYPAFIWRPRWGWFHRNFVYIFLCIVKQNLWAIVRHCLRNRIFSRFGTTPTCGGSTKGRTGATENAGVENAIRSKLQGRKMREWKKQEQIAGVENAGVENARVYSRSGKCRSKLYGTPNRDYSERILSYLNLVR